MPLHYRSREHMQKLESCCVDVEKQREQLKSKINEAIDELLDEEISQYFDRQEKRAGVSFLSYMRGIYYLTLARFFNPLAYRMAWQVVNKLNNEDGEDVYSRRPRVDTESSDSLQVD